MPASPSMNVIADSQDAVFMKALSSVTAPVCARSFAMSSPRSPSEPTTTGSSISRAPSCRTAGDSLIGGSLLIRPRVPVGRGLPAARSAVSRRVLAYGVAVALGERDLTDAGPDSASGSGLRAAFPWTGVVAPWLVSRVLSMVVLLVGAHDPARGSRFTQVATRWDGAFYFDIARHGYGSVDVPFPKWPFFPGLAGLIRALS